MSRQALPRLLGALAILFLVVIAFELFGSNPDETDMNVANVANPTDIRSGGPTAVPPAAPTAPTVQWVNTILARPLFSPTRRPDAAPQQQQTASQDDGPSDLPRLSGILLLRDSKQAVFQPTGDQKPIVVAEGGDVSGWTVQSISATEVTLTGPGGTTTLEPKFDENLVPPAPQVPNIPVRAGVPPTLNQPNPALGQRNLPPGTPVIPKLGVPPGRTPRRGDGSALQTPQQQQQQQRQTGPAQVTPTGPIPRGASPEGGR
ncbi:MAG TPA: hypothetical protein VM689_05760 [Aliidongia sp.]|nr:hypothetical protein [Aliidongia sp.]